MQLWAGLVAFLGAASLAPAQAGAANSPTFRDCAFVAGLDPDFVRLSGVAAATNGTLAVSSAQSSVTIEASESSDPFDNQGRDTLSVTVSGTGGSQRTVSGVGIGHVTLAVPLSGAPTGGQYTLNWAATFDNGLHTCPGSGTPMNTTANPFVLRVLPSSQLPPPPPPTPTPVATLRISGLHESPRLWRSPGTRQKSARARRRPVGTTFSFDLSQPASVTLAFRQTLPGRRRSGRCLKAKPHAVGPRCIRLVLRGTLTLSGGDGHTSVPFRGRIRRGPRFPPGNYVLVVTATNAAGQSAQQSIAFTIVGA